MDTEINFYICSPTFIENGKAQFRQFVDLYHQCCMTGNWFGYEGEFNSMTTLLDDSERTFGGRKIVYEMASRATMTPKNLTKKKKAYKITKRAGSAYALPV